jgi:hypothetical protein
LAKTGRREGRLLYLKNRPRTPPERLICGAVSALLMSGDRISFGRIIFRETAVHGIDEARAQQAADRKAFGEAQFGGLELFGGFFSRRLIASARP